MAIKTIRLSNANDREVAVKLLEKAHTFISCRRTDYVCYALMIAANDYNTICGQNVSIKLRDKIRQSLGTHGYVTDWLISARRIPKAAVYSNAREYRKAWIQEMIKQNTN